MSDKPTPCGTCQKPPKVSEYHECSHTACPNRKPVTAQPRDGMLYEDGRVLAHRHHE